MHSHATGIELSEETGPLLCIRTFWMVPREGRDTPNTPDMNLKYQLRLLGYVAHKIRIKWTNSNKCIDGTLCNNIRQILTCCRSC